MLSIGLQVGPNIGFLKACLTTQWKQACNNLGYLLNNLIN